MSLSSMNLSSMNLSSMNLVKKQCWWARCCFLLVLLQKSQSGELIHRAIWKLDMLDIQILKSLVFLQLLVFYALPSPFVRVWVRAMQRNHVFKTQYLVQYCLITPPPAPPPAPVAGSPPAPVAGSPVASFITRTCILQPPGVHHLRLILPTNVNMSVLKWHCQTHSPSVCTSSSRPLRRCIPLRGSGL